MVLEFLGHVRRIFVENVCIVMQSESASMMIREAKQLKKEWA